MNCAEFQEVVHDLARDASFDETTRQSALVHAHACPHCEEMLADARWLTLALRSLASEDGAEGAPGYVEEALRGAFRDNKGPVVHSTGFGWWMLAGAGSLAAAVLLSVLSLYLHDVTGPKLNDGGSASSITRTIPPTTAAVSQPQEQVPRNDSPRNNKVNPTSRKVGLQDLDSKLASAFVPLPFGEDPMLPEDEVVVRVWLPPAAFASFGVPVSDAGRDENILADVIVGEDGTPRAVRVVD
jgi:hypothetical protein